jgi:RNA polymerase sigma-70 factor (family 1)
MSDSENTQLLQQIKTSNTEAFKTVFHQYQEGIFNFLNYKLGNIPVAEDILQDVFAALWENRHQLKSDSSLKAYLYTLARNMALNYLRHQNVVRKFEQIQSEMSSNEAEPSPEKIAEEKELHETILNAANRLPEMQRIVFKMSRLDGLPNREIAERLDIGVKTVETHIGRAVKKMVELLKNALE